MTDDAPRSQQDRTDAVSPTAPGSEAGPDTTTDGTPADLDVEPPSTDSTIQAPGNSTASETENATETLFEIGPSGLQDLVQRGGAFVFSTIFHLVGLLVLGLCTLNTVVQEEIISLLSPPIEEQPDEVPVELELEQDLQAATEVTQAVFDSAVAAAAQRPKSKSSHPRWDFPA